MSGESVFRTRLEVAFPKYKTVTLPLEATCCFVYSFAAECGLDICDVTLVELQ
jgi:hypothetical protein